MPITSGGYGWTVPTVAGDTGAWGTILNALFDTVDAAATVLRTAVKTKRRVGAAEGFELNGDYASPDVGKWRRKSSLGAVGVEHAGPLGGSPAPYYVPVPLREGLVVTSFESYGSSAAGTGGTASLVRVSASGAETVVSAGHNLPSVAATTTTSALAHTVVTDMAYYVKITVNSDVLITLRSVAVTYT
jgi:hypothetical protein